MDEHEFESRYFRWVIEQAFATEQSRTMYGGVLRVLYNTPFTWTMVSDANRAGDASVFRHYERAQQDRKRHKIPQEWLNMWENAAPSVLEVLVGICERWHQFYEYQTQYFFSQLFRNLGLHVYTGENLRISQEQQIRAILDRWLTRQFEPNGKGSPFPLRSPFHLDMRDVDIWGQMNAYALENFA